MKKHTSLLLAMLLMGLTSIFLVRILRKNQEPKSVARPTLDSLINIHGSPEYGLRICGRTYRRVKGGPPYYIAVPTTSLVLLAYEALPGTKTLVICNTNDCTFREIPLGDAVFGDQIGYWASTKGRMGDTIESVSSNRVTLLSKGFRYVERSVLDLNDDTIRIVEVQSERNQIKLDWGTNQQLRIPAPQ